MKLQVAPYRERAQAYYRVKLKRKIRMFGIKIESNLATETYETILKSIERKDHGKDN